MNIVVDTNVVISGLFFGGMPRKVLELIIDHKCHAFVSMEIINEYIEIANRMQVEEQKSIDTFSLAPFIKRLFLIKPISKINICRDPDDNKFIECANDAGAIYIVSGDKDLLDLKKYKNIKIVTVKDFLDSFYN